MAPSLPTKGSVILHAIAFTTTVAIVSGYLQLHTAPIAQSITPATLSTQSSLR